LNTELPALLAARLRDPLPGWKAHARFQPELSFGRHRGPTPNDARAAAVLILLYPRAQQWHIPLIVRPAHMPSHAGQVSLPGGAIEPGETAQEAALREYAEELGASIDDLELLGSLSPIYLFASNYLVTPWVAFSRQTPRFAPNPGEVATLLEVPLTHLRDPANFDAIEHTQRGLSFSAPSYLFQGEQIWGATSMILSELVDSLDQLEL
jgi:8-oxo-dGTP pyrophosphatase MutT (NUDIX family)